MIEVGQKGGMLLLLQKALLVIRGVLIGLDLLCLEFCSIVRVYFFGDLIVLLS